MNKEKSQEIVLAATKRFMRYGIAKTTMEDIAEDLALTKPTLYYYFNNKNHLVRAVLEQIFTEYFHLLHTISQNQSLERILDEVIQMQGKLFRRYELLGYTIDLFFKPKDEILQGRFEEFKSIHTNFLYRVFKAAEKSMEIKKTNINKVVRLYFSCMQGILLNYLFHKQTLIPANHREHLLLYKNVREFSSVFIKGLMR